MNTPRRDGIRHICTYTNEYVHCCTTLICICYFSFIFFSLAPFYVVLSLSISVAHSFRFLPMPQPRPFRSLCYLRRGFDLSLSYTFDAMFPVYVRCTFYYSVAFVIPQSLQKQAHLFFFSKVATAAEAVTAQRKNSKNTNSNRFTVHLLYMVHSAKCNGSESCVCVCMCIEIGEKCKDSNCECQTG